MDEKEEEPDSLELHKRDTAVGKSAVGSEDEEDSLGGMLSEEELEDLDEFFKNAEHLSDQTLGDIHLYDCSLQTDGDRSQSHHATFKDCSESHLGHFGDLSCSMLVEPEKSVSISQQDLEQAVKHYEAKLQRKDIIIKKLSRVLLKACEDEETETNVMQDLDLDAQLSWIENSEDSANQTRQSVDDDRNENFRLSSYVKAIVSQERILDTSNHSIDKKYCSAQTSSAEPTTRPIQNFDAATIQAVCRSFLSATKSMKNELCDVRNLLKQPFENHEDFPMRKILLGLEDINKRHEQEITGYKEQLTAELKQHLESQNTLKDEIKTMKMRFQEKNKQKDNEISDLKARLVEVEEDTHDSVKELKRTEDVIEVCTTPALDESFNSNPEEETFSNLTRTKVEYLKLTPSEYVEDEVIDTVHIPDFYRQLLDDYKLKLFDMEKKFDANKRYLEEQTHDREIERDEFQHALEMLQNQMEDLKKDNCKLYEVNKQNLYQIEEYTARLKSAEEDETELVQKHEKTESELKVAVEKIFELRDIIRDLETQIDSLRTSAVQLKEQNQVLLDELEKLEVMNKREQPAYNEQDTYATLPTDVTDEIQCQLQDLGKKIEFKLNEMDNFQWHTRPNSSCSGVASAVSTEDISCRELAGGAMRNFNSFPVEDIGSLLLNEIRRLEAQFESLTRFEDVIMKKLKDTELRCSGQKVKLEELENQITIYQDKCSTQMLRIADLEGQVDSLRFETSNQGVILSLKTKLGTVSKQVEDYKAVLANKDRQLAQLQAEINTLKAIEQEITAKKNSAKNASSQTNPMFESSLSLHELTFDGVSPEKIRKMDIGNALSTYDISMSKHTGKDRSIVLADDDDAVLTKYSERKQEKLSGKTVGMDPSSPGQSLNKRSSNREYCKCSRCYQRRRAHDEKRTCENALTYINWIEGFTPSNREIWPSFKSAPMCLKNCICKCGPVLRRKLSTNTMHTIESLVDIRSWCPCEHHRRQYFLEQMNREGCSSFAGGDHKDSSKPLNIEGMNRAFDDVQADILEKSKMIEDLQKLLARRDDEIAELRQRWGSTKDSPDGNCERENVTLDTELHSGRNCMDNDDTRSTKKKINQTPAECGDSIYEIQVASEYEADGELLKYLGTRILSREDYRGPLKTSGQGRIQETDFQIEIATLNTQIRQLRSALDEERRRSEDLVRRLKACEEGKAELRSRSPVAPAHHTTTSISEQQFQQRETARQIEKGRDMLVAKDREIRNLREQIQDFEKILTAKVAHEQELNNRFNNTSLLLKKCEDHGRELTALNQDNLKEIRRLRGMLDRTNVNTSAVEVYPVSVGSDHFDNFMRAKSHKKALAWQKKYLSSVVLGYKSILRQVGHGNEHPELLQTQVPLAPSAVGLLDHRRPITKFRIRALTIIAVVRMKYMVNRWVKKAPGETSPDSEYRASRNSSRVDSSVARPSKSILMNSRVNYSSLPPPRPLIEHNIDRHERYGTRGVSLEDISEYLTRFESLENEISHSLCRNVYPS